MFPLDCAKGLGARVDDLPLTNGGEQRLKLSKSSRGCARETGVGPRAPLASQLGWFSLGPKVFSLGPKAFSPFVPKCFGSKFFLSTPRFFLLAPRFFPLALRVFLVSKVFTEPQGFHSVLKFSLRPEVSI